MENKKLEEMLLYVAPGTPLREGLNNILEAKLGALIVVGTNEVTDKIIDGGFYLNCDFTPERIYELAKMDGAIIVDDNCEKILYANVHLQPDRKYKSVESGTRHRTAQRTAEQTGKLVVAISERRNIITLYKEKIRYRLKDYSVIENEVSQGIKTMERYKEVLDRALSNLTVLELDNTVTIFDVATALQRFEMLRRIGIEVKTRVIELGSEGRLINLQFQDLNQDVEEIEMELIKDYIGDNREYKEVKELMNNLNDEELLQVEKFSNALGFSKNYSNLDNEVTARGYRLLGQITKLTKKDVEKLISEYKSILKLQDVSDDELLEMKMSKSKIKALRVGLKRLKITVELEKF